jgi:hypothetical protein
MKYAIVALLAIHGLIHAVGFAGTWGLAQFEGASQTPTNFVTVEADGTALKFIGLLWIVALVAFLAAAALLVTDGGAWRPVAVGAAVISMVPVTLWWKNAPMGALANALVVAAVLFADRLELA